jgi:hypothetical protein
MKNSLWIFSLILVAQVCQAQDDTFNYFGQPVPGDTPQLFAPGIISIRIIPFLNKNHNLDSQIRHLLLTD